MLLYEQQHKQTGEDLKDKYKDNPTFNKAPGFYIMAGLWCKWNSLRIWDICIWA